MAELACNGWSPAPENAKQDIIDRHGGAAGQGKITDLFRPAETATNGFVYGCNGCATQLDGPHRIGRA